MACMAQSHDRWPSRSARELAKQSKLPLPTVSRLLKELLHAGLLVSHRGNRGGYSLAHAPRELSVLDIIAAVEGPVAFTECSAGELGRCDLETCCSIKSNQRLINKVVRAALENITLSDLIRPMKLTTIQTAQGESVAAIAPGGIQ
jgi:FeS assembly SUF system regulator